MTSAQVGRRNQSRSCEAETAARRWWGGDQAQWSEDQRVPNERRSAAAVNPQSSLVTLRLLARFKAVREGQGMTLAEVAKRMGIDAAAVALGNGQGAETHAGYAAQMGGSTRIETERGFVVPRNAAARANDVVLPLGSTVEVS